MCLVPGMFKFVRQGSAKSRFLHPGQIRAQSYHVREAVFGSVSGCSIVVGVAFVCEWRCTTCPSRGDWRGAG